MTTPPSRVSKIVHKHRKPVAEMITKELKKTNWDNKNSVNRLYSWLNGVAAPETDPKVRAEILKLRSEVNNYGRE